MTKNIYLILPLLSALSWGMLYAINSKNYQAISVPTGLLTQAVGMALCAFVISGLTKTSFDFAPYLSHPDKIWLWVAPFVVIAASGFLHMALAHTSASYAALGEVAYVVCTPLFAWLLFGQKELNTTMLIGAGFILVGLYFIVSGQAQKSALPGV